MNRIRIFQLPVCDARVFVVQLNSGMKDHVCIFFCIRISRLPDAHVLVVQSERKDHVCMCMFRICNVQLPLDAGVMLFN